MPFFDVSPEALKEAQQMGSNALVVPDDARPVGDDAWQWTEAVMVDKVSDDQIVYDGSADTWYRYNLQLRIQPLQKATKNSNRVIFGDHQINKSAYIDRKEDHGRSKWAISRLSELLKAAGYTIDKPGEFKEAMEDAFKDESPLRGVNLWVELKQHQKMKYDENRQLVKDGDKVRIDIQRYIKYEG
jgi:hypothetical protein